jgi:chromosome segregation ATPase
VLEHAEQLAAREQRPFDARALGRIGRLVGLRGEVVQRRQLATAGGGEAAVEGGSTDSDTGDTEDLERERLALASELNKLEADFERGDIDEETYNAERDEILEQLRLISLRMRGLED